MKRGETDGNVDTVNVLIAAGAETSSEKTQRQQHIDERSADVRAQDRGRTATGRPPRLAGCARERYLALRSFLIVSASIVPVGESLLSLWNFLSASTVLGPATPSTVPSL